MTAREVRRGGRGHKEDDKSQRLKFHGARPLAIGASSVSGPPQCGQLSSASELEVFTSWLFGLLVVVESSCLAFSSS